MVYELTGMGSKAKAPDWKGTDVVRPLAEKRGMLMSMCVVVGRKDRCAGAEETGREASYEGIRPARCILE